MKKYKLKLKEEFREKRFDYSGMVKCSHDHENHIWVHKTCLDRYCFTYTSKKKTSSEFTLKEINELPHGFIKIHDIIEVKEQLYYIKLPLVSYDDNFLNEEPVGRVVVGNNKHSDRFKTKFTKSEIEEKFPMYANDTFMVKVEDVE